MPPTWPINKTTITGIETNPKLRTIFPLEKMAKTSQRLHTVSKARLVMSLTCPINNTNTRLTKYAKLIKSKNNVKSEGTFIAL